MLDFGTAGIDRYVTLGSPHAPPPAGADGVVDQTRGILTFCADACPGAHHPEACPRRSTSRHVPVLIFCSLAAPLCLYPLPISFPLCRVTLALPDR